MSFYVVQAQPFTLSGAGASIGDTSVILSSFKQIDGSTNLTMANFGTIGFATIEPGNGTQEEAISFTGVTQNSNGTATLTGVSSTTFITPYTATSGLTKTHAGGTQLVLSNTAAFYSEFPALPDNATITGTYVFTNPSYPKMDASTPLPTLAAQLATKAYVDSVAVAGAPNADTVTKGIVQLSTGTQVAAGTATGSTGASLVPPNSLFNSAFTGTTTVVVTDTTGKISSGFGGSASGVATLNGSSLVIQDPASATITATLSSIPKTSGSSTKLSGGWIGMTTSGDTVYYDGSAIQRAAIGSQNQVLKVNSSTLPAWSDNSKIYTTTTPVTVTNTGTETNLISFTLPANTLSTNKGVYVRLDITAFNSAANAFTLRWKYGATTLVTKNLGGTAIGGGTNAVHGIIEFILYGNAATNAQVGLTRVFLSNETSTDFITNRDTLFNTATASSAEDSTTALAVAISVQWAAASATNVITMNDAFAVAIN